MNLEQNLKETGNVARLVNRLSKDISTMALNQQQNLQKIDVNLRKSFCNQRNVVACFSYAAQMEDELDLKEGDELEIIDDVEDGWARGEIKNSPINPKAQGKIGLFPTNFVVPSNSSLSTAVNSNKFKEMAKVIYKYEAANPDELSLPEGALITVLNKNCEDEGWYEGEYNGKRGLFPENFVKLLDPILVNDKPPTAIGSNLPINAPTLPTKPIKAISSVSNRQSIVSETPNLINQTPVACTRENSLSNGSTPHLSTLSSVANLMPDTATSFPVALNAKEERKSLVAGIQNKLFPAGKLPPLPTKQQFQSTNGNGNFTELKTVENSYEKLFSLTKNRPKQMNKRPPSLNMNRNSAAQFSVNLETSSADKTLSVVTQSLSNTVWNNNVTTSVASANNNLVKKNNAQSSISSRNNVPTPLSKPKHLSFGVFSNLSQSNSPSTTNTTITTATTTTNSTKFTTSFAPHSVVTSITSTSPTITSVPSLSPSITGNKENGENEMYMEFVSRREFDLFRTESERKIQELTQKIVELQKSFLNLRCM